jgi:hypothetical protein
MSRQTHSLNVSNGAARPTALSQIQTFDDAMFYIFWILSRPIIQSKPALPKYL